MGSLLQIVVPHFFIRLFCFVMQEDQKTYKHHKRNLGRDASPENLAKSYQVSDVGEAEMLLTGPEIPGLNQENYLYWLLRKGRCTSGMLFLCFLSLYNWKTANSKNAAASDPFQRRWLLKAERPWGKTLASYSVILSLMCYTAWQIEQHFHDVYMFYNTY